MFLLLTATAPFIPKGVRRPTTVASFRPRWAIGFRPGSGCFVWDKKDFEWEKRVTYRHSGLQYLFVLFCLYISRFLVFDYIMFFLSFYSKHLNVDIPCFRYNPRILARLPVDLPRISWTIWWLPLCQFCWSSFSKSTPSLALRFSPGQLGVAFDVALGLGCWPWVVICKWNGGLEGETLRMFVVHTVTHSSWPFLCSSFSVVPFSKFRSRLVFQDSAWCIIWF